MLGQWLACLLTHAVDRYHAGWNAGLSHAGPTVAVNGLHSAGLWTTGTGGQRRRNLPRRQHERRIPRRDDAHGADRHAGRDIPMLLADEGRRGLPRICRLKKRKFSAARIAALAMKRWAWPVSMHSSTAMSSAWSSIASATRCRSFLRVGADTSRTKSVAAVAARSTSSALPRATWPAPLIVSKVWPEEPTARPCHQSLIPSAFRTWRAEARRAAIGLEHVG